MSKFIRHTSCPKCGSSDANAVYQGGSTFCFSCRSSSRGSRPVFHESVCDLNENVPSLPYDVGFNYPQHCLDWVFKYGVTINELIKNKVYWSEEKQQLIFTFYDEEGSENADHKLLLWQARNFGPWASIKYVNHGKPEQVLPIIRHTGTGRSLLVLVEDCISAIKIARISDAMPVLGSDLSLSKLKRLRGSKGRPGPLPGLSRAIVWLDGNMYPKAQRIAQRLQLLGIEAKAIYTELDPKEYSDEEIKCLTS